MGKKLAALPVLCLIALGEALPALAQQTPQPAAPQPLQGYYWPGPWHHMWGDGYGWSVWWMVPMMTLWILIIAAILFFAWRVLAHGPYHRGPHWRMMERPWGDPTHSALQILNERFARGEIETDEYEAKKAAILSGAPR